jgi:DNA-binding response OmpR family regulator
MAKKILIIDDDKDIVDNIANVLKSNGYEVIRAYSGSEGLKKALSEKPDLMILDVIMETDTAGFEVANQIRSKRSFSKYKDINNIPIIILTSIDQVTDSRFSMDEKNNFLPGINSFIIKPINFDALLIKIRELL